jgi:hypothetical protein
MEAHVRIPRWKRSDSVALEVLLASAGIALAVVGIVAPLLGIAGLVDPVAATRDIPLHERAALGGATTHGAITLTGTRTAELAFAEPDLAQRTLLALPGLVGAGLALTIVWLLLRIVRTLTTGDPFRPVNVRRVTGIAVAVIAFGIQEPLLSAVNTGALVRGTAAEDVVPFELAFSWAPILVGLLIAALAEVFRRGTRLRADTEGLV